MPQFRTKPVVVEAVHWNGFTLGLTNKPVDLKQPADPSVHFELPKWMPKCLPPLATEALTRASVEVGEVRRYEDFLHIGTREGVKAAAPGDWIVRRATGEIFPCKPDEFDAAYEPVT